MPGRWKFSGSAWYWDNKAYGTALFKQQGLPDRAVLRFDLGWRNRLSIAIAFHADFAKPKLVEENVPKAEPVRKMNPRDFVPGDSNILPLIFGNSYVLQIYSTNMMLFRTSVDGPAGPTAERVQIVGNGIRLGDSGKATMEVRSNRLNGEIALFINDEFVVQWNEASTGELDRDQFAGKGNGFGFVVQTEETPVKISDVMIAEWNGMPDSARSLQVDEQDIVLLANGTDRFAGDVGSLKSGKLDMSAKYGQFQFELDDVAEIRFARNRVSKTSDPDPKEVAVRLSPFGKISGLVVSGDRKSVKLVNPIAGEMNVNLESAVMLDFNSSNNYLDDWDTEF